MDRWEAQAYRPNRSRSRMKGKLKSYVDGYTSIAWSKSTPLAQRSICPAKFLSHVYLPSNDSSTSHLAQTSPQIPYPTTPSPPQPPTT